MDWKREKGKEEGEGRGEDRGGRMCETIRQCSIVFGNADLSIAGA